MADKNEVTLEGTIQKDPDLLFVGSKNTPLCKFTILTVEGQFKSFHKCQAWREKGAEIAEQFRDGQRVRAHGTLSYNTYNDKEGKKCYATNITIFGMTAVDAKGEKAGQPADPGQPAQNCPDEEPPF